MNGFTVKQLLVLFKSAFVLKACFNKNIMEAPVKHNRSTVIVLKIDSKKFLNTF